jgi:serine/threonine-protein kinase
MIVVVAVLAMTRATHAQPKGAEAEVLFRQGKELMAAGKIAEACAAFDASQKLDPTVATLMNQANCREKNGQLATAWGLFLEVVQTRATTDQASQQLHAVATARVAKLEPRLSTLRIDVPADSRIGGLEVLRDGEVLDPAAWNKAMPTDGGTYTIAARAPGNAAWSSTIAVATERDAKTIEIPRLRAAELVPMAPKVEGPSVVSTPEPPSTLVARETSAVWSMKRKIAVGTAGGGVLALAVGTVLGVSAKNKQSDAHALCPEPQLPCGGADRANDLVRSGHNLAIGADVAFGVGAAATIAAGVLWFTGAPESPHRIAIVPSVSPGQVGVFAKRSF